MLSNGTLKVHEFVQRADNHVDIFLFSKNRKWSLLFKFFSGFIF